MNNKNMRILIFHPALAPYRVDFFNELGTRVNLKVVFLRSNLLSQKFDQSILLKSIDVEHDYLLRGINVKSRLFRFGIKKCIKEYKPDFVVAPEYSPVTIWLKIMLYTVKQPWELIVWTDDNLKMLREMKLIKRLIISCVLRNPSGLLVCSKGAMQYYKKKFNLLEGSIGICPIVRNEITHRSLLQELLPEAEKLICIKTLKNKKILLFVGRLVSIKGVDRLIKVFANISKRMGNMLLVIVGDGPEREKLKKLAIDEGVQNDVIFEGRLEGNELHCWYLVSDLFILPSHYEPYGTVVNEALLAGLPVICSSYAGASDLIVNGKNGFIFDPFNLSEMERYIRKALDIFKRSKINTLHYNMTPVKFNESVDEFIKVINYIKYLKTKNIS